MVIRVRIADVADQARLIGFIHDHWSSTHVFTERPEVFAWQHLQQDGRLNMVLAEDSESPNRPVLAVLGFIPMGRFDPALGDRDLMLAIWKVRDEGVPPGVGLRLLKFLQQELEPRLIAAIGTSTMVRPIYQALRYQVGKLHHAAVFHPDLARDARIARGVPDGASTPLPEVPDATLQLVPLDESASADLRAAVDRAGAGRVPAKSWSYVAERYLHHPWYRYQLRAVRHDGEIVAAVVWRAVEANGAKVLRIVDVIGDTEWLASGAFALQREVIAAGAEHIDLVQWGTEPAFLESSGFVGTDANPRLVLPNYFSPFEARNVEIEIAFKVLDGSDAPVHLYRADSDQDRPNRVDEVDAPS